MTDVGGTGRTDSGLLWHLVMRQVRQDYLQNVTGMAWLVLQPLLLLGAYAFVFGTIFEARIPGADATGFVPWLAVAFWPWVAFSDAVVRGSDSVVAHAALVGKVAFPVELLPLSTVTAVFGMNAIGYAVVLAVLQLAGTDIQWVLVPAAVGVMVLLYALACGLVLITSTLQVFLRDIEQLMPPLMTLWFFLTPIIYSRELLPERLTWLADINPMAWFVTELRGILLPGPWQPGWEALAALVGALVLLLVGLRFFRRLEGHFEDFL